MPNRDRGVAGGRGGLAVPLRTPGVGTSIPPEAGSPRLFSARTVGPRCPRPLSPSAERATWERVGSVGLHLSFP